MSSTKDFLDYVVDQVRDQDRVRTRKMFGEYALYYDEKVVALICDNQLFIKNLEAGRSFIEKELGKENFRLTPPFPGAKDWILLEDEIENREFLNELLEIIRENLEKKRRISKTKK